MKVYSYFEEPDNGQKPEEYWNGPGEHGFRPMNDPDYGPIPEPYRVNGMSKAALVCGLLSLITMLFGYGTVFALLGILFACLSGGKKMPKQAKVGIAMCATSLAVFLFSFFTLMAALTSSGAWPELVRQAKITDFSDQDSVMELEHVIYDAFVKSLLPSDFGMSPVLNPGTGRDRTSDGSGRPGAAITPRAAHPGGEASSDAGSLSPPAGVGDAQI